jgi:hypothetical protein
MYAIRNHHRKQTLRCKTLGKNWLPEYQPDAKYCRRYIKTTLQFVHDNVDVPNELSLQYSKNQVTGVAYGVHKIEVCNEYKTYYYSTYRLTHYVFLV